MAEIELGQISSLAHCLAVHGGALATSPTSPQLNEQCVNCIRFLAVDAVQKAKSGHPGAPMGAAVMAYALWDRVLKHNPADPSWADRDRFVLSAGHASMLLYSLLYLTGYDLSLEDIKAFRQWDSKTPGHPELGVAPGVEMTTGPLGQGFAHGVGMAVAQKWLADHYNRPGHEIIDHQIYAFVSDGDLEEGVSSEAASLAGTLKLGKLVYLYDDNGISIEGDTDIAFTEDVGVRFQAYGWHVVDPVDGTDIDAVERAIQEGRREATRPSLIVVKTTIGFGSPNKANTGGVHGSPLGDDEVALTRENLNWPYEPFDLPSDAVDHMRQALERGAADQAAWTDRFVAYRRAFPVEAAQLEIDLRGDLPVGWASKLSELFAADEKPIATREASNRVMNAIAKTVHGFTGGSADLAPSTLTILKDHGDFGFEADVDHNMHFGVREHAMGSIAGGMALHGGIIPYTATFLIFSDYMRPPIRLAALQGQRVVYIFSHDSIGLGEDGPTHQPVEQLLGLRSVPNLVVLRPGDATETSEAWRVAIERRDGPSVLVTTRQVLPIIDRKTHGAAEGVQRGGYVLLDPPGAPEAILIGTGSEVPLALDAAALLADRGVTARVVSMVSWELFDAQPQEYRDAVLPPSVKARVSVEAGVTMGWERYVGSEGVSVGIDHFGASAPFQTLYQEFGITAERVAGEAEELVKRGRG
jgi:transketolase